MTRTHILAKTPPLFARKVLISLAEEVLSDKLVQRLFCDSGHGINLGEHANGMIPEELFTSHVRAGSGIGDRALRDELIESLDVGIIIEEPISVRQDGSVSNEVVIVDDERRDLCVFGHLNQWGGKVEIIFISVNGGWQG